jgi:MFS family permease
MRAVWAARLVIVAAFLDLFMQFPVVAPYARHLGASAVWVGLVVGAYSVANLLGNLLAGVALDRWGRVRPIQAGLLGTALALVCYSLAQGTGQLLAARVLHGLAASVLAPGAFALIADAAPPDRRGRAMGVNGALIAVCGVLGPPLAGVLRDRAGPAAAFLTAATIMLASAAIFAILARRIPAPAVRRAPAPALAERRRIATALLGPRLGAAVLAALALTLNLGILITHLPLALVERGEAASRTGLAFTAYAAVAMLVMAGPLNRLGDRYGRTGPLAIGLATTGAGMLALAAATGMPGVVVGMAVFGLGFGLLFPAATALVADAGGPRGRGAAFGIFYAVYSLGVALGSALSGLLGSAAGDLSSAPFLVGAAVALATAPAVLVTGRWAVALAEA